MYRPRKQAILRGFQHEDRAPSVVVDELTTTGAPSVVVDELTTTELTGVSPWVTYYHVNTPTSHPHTT